MKLSTKIIGATATSLSLLVAPAVYAKAHDQGSTDDPGSRVFVQTVGPAQSLGSVRGNSANTPAAEKSNRPEKEQEE